MGIGCQETLLSACAACTEATEAPETPRSTDKQTHPSSGSCWDRTARHWDSHLHCRTLNVDVCQAKLPWEQNLRHHSQQTHPLRSFESYLAMKSSHGFMDVPSCICTCGWRNWDALSGYGGSSRLWKSHPFQTSSQLPRAPICTCRMHISEFSLSLRR